MIPRFTLLFGMLLLSVFPTSNCFDSIICSPIVIANKSLPFCQFNARLKRGVCKASDFQGFIAGCPEAGQLRCGMIAFQVESCKENADVNELLYGAKGFVQLENVNQLPTRLALPLKALKYY